MYIYIYVGLFGDQVVVRQLGQFVVKIFVRQLNCLKREEFVNCALYISVSSGHITVHSYLVVLQI